MCECKILFESGNCLEVSVENTWGDGSENDTLHTCDVIINMLSLSLNRSRQKSGSALRKSFLTLPT